MKCTSTQFDEALRDGKLVLTLMGMSNVGKSYWSRELAKMGFYRICSDVLLQEKLHREKVLGEVTDEALAAWLGMPYEERFVEQQKRFLDLERELFVEILCEIKNGAHRNTVIDPAGSFIYAGDSVCNEFKARSCMVYLEATTEMREEMFERFMKFPKALVWGELFTVQPGESEQQALARSYLKLLEYRANLYRQYADVTIPYPELPRGGSGDIFLDCVSARL